MLNKNQNLPPLLIVTGEISGELHALELIKQVQAFSFALYGMGGENLANAGVNLLVDTKKLHVMGINDLLKSVKEIYFAWRRLKTFIKEMRPIVVLVDYPDFNLRLAKVAKEAGCKVLYFISPTIWAWRPKRIELIRRYVDSMAVIYPFEVEYYRQRGINVNYVGNVLLKRIEQHLSLESLHSKLNLNPKVVTLGLFPGSRISEIKYLMLDMLDTARFLSKRIEIQLVLSKAISIEKEIIDGFLSKYPDLKIIVLENSYDVITVSDVVLAASGTATLEIALSEKPLVIIYRGKWWEYQLARKFLKIPNVGLCNILAGYQVAPEFLQDQISPQNLSDTLLKLLQSSEERQKQVKVFQQIKRNFLDTPVVNFKKILEELIECS